MGKDVKQVMNIEERKNKGFSMVELLTAIAILGILSASALYFMSTSSKTYDRLSVESQLQSEAQLVANMITELAIDSYDAANTSTEDFGYVSTNGKLLILDSSADGAKKQYIIGRKAADNELYLAEREYIPSSTGGAWGATSEALLGNYIQDFNVDTSRVEEENMLQFTLSYVKNGRTYDGNYQVLMRNRAYADSEKEETAPEVSASLALRLEPQLVFIDIVSEMVPSYYIGTIAESNKRTMTATGVPFTASVISNQRNAGDEVDWKLKNADDDIFSMSAATAAASNLVWDTTGKAFKNSPTDAFTLVITKTMNTSDGKVVEANPKTAQILLRRIKSLNLYAVSGTTQWKSQYSEQFGGTQSTEAQGYAYAGTNGKYLPINLSAAISASNIAYGGGLRWQLYMKDSSGSWGTCSNASFAKLQNTETLTGTSNVVTLGAAAKNGQEYKVVATSIFDPSYSAEYIFGVAPSLTLQGDGFYSRGYYTDMTSFMDGKTAQSDNVPVSQLVYLKVTSVDGSGNIGDWQDKVKVIKDASGRWRLFIDYDAFSYSGPQKKDFYGGAIIIHLAYGYYGADGKLYLNGKGADKNDMAAYLGVNANEITQYSQDFYYQPKPVVVSKISPVNDVIVIDKGKDRNVYVQTEYYNILSPRKGTYYFGAYIDDMLDNLIQSGKSDINPYFSVTMTSSYGDTDKYVDSAGIMVTAKSKTKQKKYLTDPVTLRLTANDYYLISTTNPEAASYTDYKVLISNVEGASCYIPGPKATYAGLAWPSELDDGTEVTIQGLDTSNKAVTAKVYKSGKKYYCKYAGKTYTYNSTYNFWAE